MYNAFILLLLQLGVAVGFVLPPMLVPNSPDLETVGRDLQMMFYLVAGLTSILLVLMIFCKLNLRLLSINKIKFIIIFTSVFQDRPPTPPSAAQEEAQRLENSEGEQVSFFQSLKNLMTNRNFIFLLLSYGINVGVFYAISTLLNPV